MWKKLNSCIDFFEKWAVTFYHCFITIIYQQRCIYDNSNNHYNIKNYYNYHVNNNGYYLIYIKI